MGSSVRIKEVCMPSSYWSAAGEIDCELEVGDDLGVDVLYQPEVEITGR